MANPIKILGISGSMGEKPHSIVALDVALAASVDYGAQTRLLDLRTLDLPIFRPDLKVKPPAVQEAADAVRWADAFILASPDYHGGMSGALKNFLDYHWREFGGKLFGYICSSHDKGLTAMDQMRTAVRQCYGWSLPYGVAIHSQHDFNPSGELSNDALRQRLRLVGRDMAVYGALLVDQYARDLAAGEKETFARGE
jgi:NAD(P)H-dependent FMN reductase